MCPLLAGRLSTSPNAHLHASPWQRNVLSQIPRRLALREQRLPKHPTETSRSSALEKRNKNRKVFLPLHRGLTVTLHRKPFAVIIHGWLHHSDWFPSLQDASCGLSVGFIQTAADDVHREHHSDIYALFFRSGNFK